MATELYKALTSSDAAALIPEDLDPLLHEELLKLQPLLEVVSVGQAEGKTHEYNLRTAHPKGWFEGEATPANNKTSTYVRKTVQMKISRLWGSVTGFTQRVTRAFINALEAEIIGQLEGMANLFEYTLLHGVSTDYSWTGDAYQATGILPMIYDEAIENVIDAGGDKVTLADLDAAIAAVAKWRGTKTDPRMFFMGLEMKQVVDGLQSKVSIPLTSMELADGRIEMSAYGRTPIHESDYVVPEGTTTSPTAAQAKAAGGALADADYLYKISSVTYYGEQVAGGTGAAATTETTNNTVNVTWTADANALAYMIWRSVDAGDYQLLDIIPALTYDSAGTVNGDVEAYADAGARTAVAIEPLAAGEQLIVIVNLNPLRGLSYMGLVDDMGQRVDALTNFVELARTKDTYDFMIKSYGAPKLVYKNMAAVIRHVKLA